MAMLEINDLKVNYGVIPALKGLTFHVDEGEIVALIGANGAGKTTTLHAISAIVNKAGGVISFNGRDITNEKAYKIVGMGIAHVQEGRGIFSEMTVLENLLIGAYLRKDKAGIQADLKQVYSLFPRLEERKAQNAGTLSGGEQQMLSIGRALMAKPKMLLLDEPSMGLAPVVVEDIFKTIRRLNRELHMTILLVEQNAQMTLHVVNRAYIMENGKIVHSGTAKELRENDEIRKTYLGL